MAEINFLRIGWIELHNAAMVFGAEVDYWPEDHPELKNRRFLDAKLYSILLPRLLKYSQVNLEAYGCRSDLIFSLIFRRIRKNAKKNYSSVWKFLITAESVDVLLNQFQQSFFSTRDSQAPVFSKIQIHTIARYGMWLVNRETEDPKKNLLAMLWGLALIGVTKYLWDKQGVCEFCYRRTWPGRRFCEDHSQSQSDIKNRSANYMRYRTGKKAHQLLEKHKLTEKVQGSTVMRQINSATAMCDLLFPSSLINDDEAKADEKNMIFNALSQCPRVLRRFREQVHISYENFMKIEYDRLVNYLRQVLDPYELSYTGWQLKIFAAEIWFTAEIKVSPGVRKNGKKATARIAMAKKLAASGLTKSEIARKLGVSPSTISKWIVRKPELAKVFSSSPIS